MEYYLITFKNTHGAILAQKFLHDKIKITVMPTLRQITASCGISIRIEADDSPRIPELLEGSGLDAGMFSIYRVIRTGDETIVTLAGQ